MHVLHVIEATIGGTRRHVVDATRGLVRRGVRVSLVASALREPRFKGDLQALANDGVEVFELPMVRAMRPWTDVGHLATLRKLLQQQRPDIVHTHSSKAGALGRVASWTSGVGARVHTPHTFAFLFGAMFSGSSRALFKAIEKELARHTDRFIAVSDDEAQTFEQAGFIPGAKVRVVANGVDPRRWKAARGVSRSSLGVPEGVPCAAVVGLLNVAKGQDLALRALAAPGLAQLHLCLVGTGEMEPELRELARSLGVESRVHFLGWREDVPEVLASVDFLLLPSRWEGMPYIVLEAMAAGKPLVATPVDGARSLVGSADCGVVCEASSAEALARGIETLLTQSAAALRAKGERGRRAVQERYTLDHMVDGLVRVYGELA